MLGPADTQGKAVVDAILSAFDLSQLTSMLRFQAGMILADEVALPAPFRMVATDLYALLEQNGDTDRFIALALAIKSGNPKLQALAIERGIQPALAPPPIRAGSTVREFIAAAQGGLPHDPALDAVAVQVGAPAVPSDAALEAMVARRSRQIDFGRFQQRLTQVEERVCLIRTPRSLGTGFLVGPGLVLTNYHVVEGLIGNVYRPDDVTCEFDFNSTALQPVRIGLAGMSVASSPYAQSDLSGQGDPAEGQLDYALLPLAETVGAGPRGFYGLDPQLRLLARNDFLFVCQHAQGQALTLAMGTITDFPGKAYRIRYDVTTDHGSSGSPCLTPELDLVGLHHAADPSIQPRYNQAVPIWLIARHAKAAGAPV